MQKKRGPAPRPAEEQRTKRLSVYFTEAEYSEILQRARSRHDLCNYVRAQVFAGKTAVSVAIPEINLQSHGELGRVASNLNQIAKALHTSAPVELQQLIEDVAAFRRTLIGLAAS
jgi:hypothetical protein